MGLDQAFPPINSTRSAQARRVFSWPRMSKISVGFEFQKVDERGAYVRGWASVASVGGAPITDWQGDRISIDVIRKAAHQFVIDARVAKAMHSGSAIGEVVESIVIDDAVAETLGVTDSTRGWFIGMRIDDEGIRKRIRDGSLRAFSIGGRGRSVPIEG